jgi:putative sigma-54 modulation protein
MMVQITARQIEIPERLRSYIQSRVAKLDRYINGISDVHVTLSAEKYRQIAEVNVHSRGNVHLSAKEASDDLKTSINLAIEKIAGQAKKRQRKRIDRKRRGAAANQTAREGEGTFDLLAGEGTPSVSAPRVIESRRFVIKPLSVEEAVLAIEEHGSEFLVFRNAANDRTNVLYRRPDGNFGLIDPGRPGR